MVSHKGRHGRGSGRQKFIILTGPEDRKNTTPYRPHGGSLRIVRRQKTRVRGKSRPQSLLGLPWEMQGRAGETV